jgi:hypothetical protein
MIKINSFINESGDEITVGIKNYKFYFTHSDHHNLRWKVIDLGKWIFTDNELIGINKIIRKYLVT